jgi:phage shock protein PspC (stress-responsive transcriptional regulator)
MKKTISVNIGGILFYIEEEGYDLLKAYLESTHQRFQHQVDAKQSFANIESRVAEIFLDKLSENKAFISLEDVKQLLISLGESSDFQDTFTQTKTQEDTTQNHFKFEQAYSSAFKEWETKEHTNPPIQEPILPKEEIAPKRLFRDTSRKLIGGVASGISYYFEIDPLLIRLVFLITLVDLFTDSNNDFPFIVIAIIVYVIMWAFLPANGQLPENLKIRRFLRDPDDRMLGGVSSGFAHYFGVETIIIRFLFVISALLGFGLLMYPILWLITPISNQPLNVIYDGKNRINLADIEKKIKELFSQKEDENEKKIVSVILYPIRLLSQFSTNFPSAAKQSISGLFYFVFAMIGISLITVSSLVSIVLLSLTAMYFSTKVYEDITPFFITLDGFEGVRFETSKLLWDSIKLTVPPQTVIYSLFTIWIPFIVMGVIGASILQRRWIAPTSVNWSLLIVWIIGIIGTIVTVPMAAVEYQAEGSYKNTYSYLPSAKAIYLDVNDNSIEHFMNVELQIRGHEKENIELVQHFLSQGKSRSQAVDYAKSVLYNVQFGDSIITFDRNIQLADGTPFRGQRLKMKLLVPINKPFHLSEKMASILRNTLTPNGYTIADLEEDNVWAFDENGLRCMSCDNEESLANIKKKKIIQSEIDRFNKLSVEGNYIINVVHGKKYEIKAICGAEMGELNMQNDNGELVIGHPNCEEGVYINLIIQTPSIKEIELNGKIRAKLVGFDENKFQITLLDSAYLEANINTDKMTAELSDFSKLVLNGKTEILKLHLTGTSEVLAEAYSSEKIEVIAEDISKASVNAIEAITVISYGNSLVNYIGNPQKISVTKNDD